MQFKQASWIDNGKEGVCFLFLCQKRVVGAQAGKKSVLQLIGSHSLSIPLSSMLPRCHWIMCSGESSSAALKRVVRTEEIHSLC